MRIEIEKTLLQKALNDVIKAVPTRPVVPILSNILIELDSAGTMRLTASDAESLSLRRTLVPSQSDGEGTTTVPAKILTDLLRTLPEGTVEIESSDHNTILVTAGFSESEIPTLPAKDYPNVSGANPETAKTVTFDAGMFQDAIAKTAYAVANDAIRPALCGIHFDLAENGESHAVGTDSRTLVVYDLKTEKCPEAFSFILPDKTAAVLKGLLPKDGKVTVRFDTNAEISFDGTEVITRLIVAKYPNYKSVIPKENDKIFTVNRVELVNSLQRVAILASQTTNIAKLELENDSLRLLAEDRALSCKGSDRLTVKYDGEPLTIGFNVSLLLNVLNNISSEEIVIKLKSPRHPALFIPAEEENKTEPTTTLLMPLCI